MLFSKEFYDIDFVVVNQKWTKEDHADTSRRIAEYLAMRDSLRAQGYSPAEVQARLNSRFADETDNPPEPEDALYAKRRNRRDNVLLNA